MKRLMRLFSLLLLAAILAPGCAKQSLEPRREMGAVVEAPQAKALEADRSGQKPAVEEGPEKEAPAGEAVTVAPAVPAGATKKSRDAKPEIPLAGLLHASAGEALVSLPPDLKFILPNRAYKGEPFVLKIRSGQLEKAVIRWEGKTLTLHAGKDGQEKGGCEALLSVGLTEKAEQLPLTVTLTLDGRDVAFKCQVPTGQRRYAVQKLKVDPRFVTPPEEEKPRIERERKVMAQVLSQVTPVKYWRLPMKRPVPGEVTSLYGLRRVFNGEERGSHRGLDLNGAAGDPIHACDNGRVVLVADHYYSGQVVVVDHGLGVFTIYLHMSGFNVSEGQMVSRGDVLGFVGATGRVTGPHLHLSLNVLQNSVNPDVYLEKQYVGAR